MERLLAQIIPVALAFKNEQRVAEEDGENGDPW
jgi:hypothetical protein